MWELQISGKSTQSNKKSKHWQDWQGRNTNFTQNQSWKSLTCHTRMFKSHVNKHKHKQKKKNCEQV